MSLGAVLCGELRLLGRRERSVRLSDGNGVEDVFEGAPQPDLDAVTSYWLVLASVGFEGSIISGRGVVVMTVDPTSTQIEYAAGSCPCHSPQWTSQNRPVADTSKAAS